jgi:hypothetical protein
MRREMGQLVKTDQRDLRALPVVDGVIELQVRELDLAAARPAPLAGAGVRGAAKPRIEVSTLIPQPAGVGNLRRGAPEENCAEVRDPADMAQRLQDQTDRLPTAGRAAVDADVGASAQEIGLRSSLRRNHLCG